MKIDKTGIAAVTTHLKSTNPKLGKPGPLGPQFQLLKEGNDTVLVPPDPNQPPTIRTSEDVVNEFTKDFLACMFQPGGLTPEFLANFSTGIELFMARADAPTKAEVPDAPPNADTLLYPAVASAFKCQAVLRNEDPALLRNEDLDQIQLGQDQANGYQAMLDILVPLVQGLIARKVQAQVVLAEFVGRVYKNGLAAINRNTILLTGMQPLLYYATKSAQDAQDTKHLKAQVAHQTEAQTLDRVRTLQQGTAAPGGTSGTAQATSGTPANPGSASPPASGTPPLPPPQHAKPKHRSTGTTASKKKKAPPTS